MKIAHLVTSCLCLTIVTAVVRADDVRSAEAARTFAAALADRRFDDAVSRFDDTMKAAMPADKLAAVWVQLIGANGPHQSWGRATVSRMDPYDIVLIDAVFERGKLRMQVTIDSNLRIAGLFFLPPATDDPPVEPPPYLKTEVISQEVTVGEGEWTLPGTLTLPRQGRPRAGVVFVHGSGPNDRDETVGPNKPFRDLALGLAAHGIATLRYDKRTKVHGKRMLERGTSITVQEEVIDDALAALRLLSQREELKNAPIFLLGHSLGATFAPIIAAQHGKLDGIIMLAAVARPFEDVLDDQFGYLASLSPGPETERQIGELKKQIQRLRERKMKPGENLIGADASYWYDVCDHDAEKLVAAAASLDCRILVIQGGRDYQATRADYDVWKAGLKDHRAAKFKLFNDLNHLFAKGKGKATPTEYIEQRYVDQRVIELIAEFCRAPGTPDGAGKPARPERRRSVGDD